MVVITPQQQVIIDTFFNGDVSAYGVFTAVAPLVSIAFGAFIIFMLWLFGWDW